VNKGVVGLVIAAIGSAIAAIATGVMAGNARDNANPFDAAKGAASLQSAADLAAASNVWLILTGVAVIALLTVWSVRPTR
jgi:di/tricarboxylate transporter